MYVSIPSTDIEGIHQAVAGSRGLYHVTREANNPDVFSGFAIGMDGSVCMDGKVNVV